MRAINKFAIRNYCLLAIKSRPTVSEPGRRTHPQATFEESASPQDDLKCVSSGIQRCLFPDSSPVPLLPDHLRVPPSISPYPFHSYSPFLPPFFFLSFPPSLPPSHPISSFHPCSLPYFTSFVLYIFSPLFLSPFLPILASVSFTLSSLFANGSKEGERGRCVGIGMGIV